MIAAQLRDFAAGCELKFIQYVATDNAEVAYTLRDQPRNIVVTNQQQVDWLAFAKAE